MDNEKPAKSSNIAIYFCLALSVGLVVFLGLRLIDRPGPHMPGSGIPVEPPKEEHRVFHPDGFSVVRPVHWESKVGVGLDSGVCGGIELASPFWQKPQAVVLIAKYAEKPRVQEQAREIQFQGRPALMDVERRPAEIMESPGRLTARIAFEREGSWFLIQYSLSKYQHIIPN